MLINMWFSTCSWEFLEKALPLLSCGTLQGSSICISSGIVGGLSSSSEVLNIPITSFIASLVFTVGEGAPLNVCS